MGSSLSIVSSSRRAGDRVGDPYLLLVFACCNLGHPSQCHKSQEDLVKRHQCNNWKAVIFTAVMIQKAGDGFEQNAF